MGALDELDTFCGYSLPAGNPYSLTQFWRTRGSCVGVNFGSGGNDTCHDSVDVSLCFEDTTILIGICVIFWLLAGLDFLVSTCSTTKSLPYSRVHACKQLFVVLLMTTALCDLGYTIYQDVSGDYGGVAQFLYLSPSAVAMTMVIALLVLWQERRDGVRSSALFTIFWFCLVCYASLKLRTLILLAEDKSGVEDVFRFTTFCVQFALYFLQLVLVLIPEPPAERVCRDPDKMPPCPEESATFLSRITWWWLNGLIWRGWRVALEYKDLTDLNSTDKSEVVARTFQRSWDNEVHRAQGGTQRRRGYKRISIQDDDDMVRVVSAPQRRQRKQPEPSLVLALLKTFWPIFLSSAFFKLVQDLLNFVSPQVLKLLINFSEDDSEPDWKGYMYSALLFVTAIVQSLFLHQYFHRCLTLGMNMRSAIIAAVYRKALHLSNRARREKTVGEIVNLMSVDAQRFMDLMTYFHMIWSAPLQIVLALLFLYFTMGYAIFAGFVLMILMIPFNAAIAAKSRKYQVKQMTHKDSRIKLVNEILNGIKVIKLYAWEIPFQRQVKDIRQKELDVLKASAYLNAAASFTWTCAPFLVSLVTFGTYTLINLNTGERLTPDKAFVALSLFNILRFPLAMLPMLISNLVQASVSVKRVGAFLRCDELDPDIVDWRREPAKETEDAVRVSKGTFTWGGPTTDNGDEDGANGDVGASTLSNLNFRIARGQLVAVVGQVGAGKSSLISALLGEMDKVDGHVSINGQVAYVPQQAWIQNATIQSNILFGEPMQGLRYSETLHCCALEPDLEILPGGDQTEIGEKGINLSGGQKQRVSLARAVFQEADIYLLDDPLSAVDSQVGKHIFNKVIGPEGMIRNKTRIMVTHGINHLPQCDQIIVLTGGRISEIGSYGELLDADGAFAEFIRVYSGMAEEEGEGEGEGAPSVSEYAEYKEENLELEHSDSHTGLDSTAVSDNPETRARRRAHGEHMEKRRISESSVREKSERRRHVSKSELQRQLSKQMSEELKEKKVAAAEPTDRLIQDEKVETGSVHMSVMLAYIRACTYPLSILTIILYLMANGASLASNFWLADWSNSNIPANANKTTTACDKISSYTERTGCYLGVYGAFGIIQSVIILFAAFGLALSAIFASRTLHNSMLENILRSPMAFFDTTPLGRILNRFSKDTYIIDEVIPRTLRSFIFTFLTVVATLIVIVVTTPPFLVIIVPLLVFYAMIQRFYVATSRQLKRLESTTRSPIYSHFQESIMGVSSIRAYRVQERFVLESEHRVDYNQLAYYPSICSNRWLAIRLEFMGNLIILFAALFAVIQRNYQDEIKIRINPGLVGLSISYALQVTQSLNWVVRMTSEMETNIVAVERVKEYSETPQEGMAIIPSNRPPPEWPVEGHVKFDHYSTRYRENLNLVLRDITIDIAGGTKVGIVGRTGAGKSSLTLALFRIIEAATGSIKIDNVMISTYGLSDVRSRLTIIPQDPVLFSGSLRMNLDPFDQYSDADVWHALESAHLKSFASSLAGGLQYMISEGGENLSVGQRQLVCLARALLRKTKILVLDEATAAVDLETDDLIQKTIRSEFADCTILTIAHRLNTIMDYDYVMVLESGRIVEYKPPGQLLNDKRSSFYAMAKDANLVV